MFIERCYYNIYIDNPPIFLYICLTEEGGTNTDQYTMYLLIASLTMIITGNIYMRYWGYLLVELNSTHESHVNYHVQGGDDTGKSYLITCILELNKIGKNSY